MKKFLPYLASLCFFAFTAQAAAPGATVFSNAAVTATLVQAVTGPAIISGENIGANTSSGAIYLQFFDAASTGSITLGTTPPKFWVCIPVNGVLDGPSALTGAGCTNGFVIAATTTPTGNTAPSVAIPVVLMTN